MISTHAARAASKLYSTYSHIVYLPIDLPEDE